MLAEQGLLVVLELIGRALSLLLSAVLPFKMPHEVGHFFSPGARALRNTLKVAVTPS